MNQNNHFRFIFNCIFVANLLISSSAYAQLESPVTWSSNSKKDLKSGTQVLLTAKLKPGWHIFSQHVNDGGPTPTTISYVASNSFSLLGKSSEPKGLTYYEKLFKMNLTYFENEVTFQQKIKLTKPGANIQGKVEFMACNAKECLPPDEVEFSVATR
jgi:DsbC/DsbD-like thiol-disulfide interchange protein